MAAIGEQMAEALKTGISIPGQQEETPEAAKESAPATDKVETPPVSSESKPEVISASTPPAVKQRFEDNPGFKNVLKQRDSFKSELDKAQKLNQELMDALKAGRSTQPANTQEAEMEAAASQLRKLLGLEDLTKKLDSLEKRNTDYTTSQRNDAFDKEQEKIVSECKRLGIDFQEVAPELSAWLDENLPGEPKPGYFTIAFKAMNFDKSLELAKREAYAEQLREKEKLKKANSEAPSPGASQTPGAYTGIKDFARNRIESAGGVTFPGS